MPMIDVNGTSLYYEDTGPGSTGETIVFSHGLLWGTEQFAPQMAALRDRYRCIAWDHRGQGRSAPEYRHCIGIELVWQDAVALLEKLGLSNVYFAGLSMGGFVAMRVAARRPDLVKKLILLETAMGPEPIENVGRYRMLNVVSKALGPLGPKVLGGKVGSIMLGRSIMADASRKDDVAGFVQLMLRRRDVWRAVNGVIDRAGISQSELARIKAPTLVIVGDEDVATPHAKAQEIVAAIAGARLVTIPRAGHSSPVEEPAAVTAALEAFLVS
jgi:pimeloyl-ACP methyl ester carboxylesterase